MKVVKSINKVLNKFGAQLERYPSVDLARRMKLLKYLQINNVLDVGANVGNYVGELFELGYSGKAISFEPLKNEYGILLKNTSNNKNWTCYNYALGEQNENAFINVAANKDSSSILPMLDAHIESAPNSKYFTKQEIQIKKLDAIYDKLVSNSDNIYLKIDTQGYEMQVLKGAANSLKFIKCVQLELSIIPLYEGATDYRNMLDYMYSAGFHLVSVENGFSNPLTGELLQFDGIFARN